MPPSFNAFADEIQRIEKSAGIGRGLRGFGKWLGEQYNHLGVAAGEAMHGYQTVHPITGQVAPPIAGTIKNFIGNHLPKPKKPPGAVLGGVQKILESKPVQAAIPILDQASNFVKLGGRSVPLPKTQKCWKCTKPAVKRVFWCEHRAYLPTCESHLDKTIVHLKKQNFNEIDSIEKVAQVMPYQQKTQYSCSAACLKAVLDHWGADRYAEHEIMHAIGVRDHGGAEVTEITEGAKKLGFQAYDKCFKDLEEARALTDQEIPIIADFQSFNNPGKGHYVVIVSIYDDVVHLMDPNTPGNARVITRAECEKRWWDKTMAPPHSIRPKWGVVVTPRG